MKCLYFRTKNVYFGVLNNTGAVLLWCFKQHRRNIKSRYLNSNNRENPDNWSLLSWNLNILNFTVLKNPKLIPHVNCMLHCKVTINFCTQLIFAL